MIPDPAAEPGPAEGALTRRVVARLVLVRGRLAEAARLTPLRDPADPVAAATACAGAGANEIVLHETVDRGAAVKLVEQLAAKLSIPFTVSGGIRRAEEVEALLGAGAARVALNSAALIDPSLVEFCAARFAKSRIVVAVDARARMDGSPEVFGHGGTLPTGRDVVSWCRQAAKRGAGEILLHSMDRQGSREGFDLDLIRAAALAVTIPVVASGGAGAAEHFVEAFAAGARGCATSSALLAGELSLAAVKQTCADAGIELHA